MDLTIRIRAPFCREDRRRRFKEFVVWVIPKLKAEMGADFRWDEGAIQFEYPPVSLMYYITDTHIIQYLNKYAYSQEQPTGDVVTIRSESTVDFIKSAIAIHHPAGPVDWTPDITNTVCGGRGNPARSAGIKEIGPRVGNLQIKGRGPPKRDQRPLMLKKFEAMLLILLKLANECGEGQIVKKSQYRAVRTGLLMQWNAAARGDNTNELSPSDFKAEAWFDWLFLFRMLWSKNLTKQSDIQDQVVFPAA
uniref:Uncharacterized protein n=1 Tax=Chromera velia CCMP2878 TaxID=1169474 RepID=A0A0G4EYZ7_9ALVE|eukprot:Cvel_2535.t1-p1 / transcript=Cvel_2535.t1 / gene=Cvel_2535 / organism=Chromera_velia_CCMP2878 / gene_product=hypothetical protein / transcript_product=hypothetical protein / location=Cvel_scaffold100:51107-51850(+) / protein_length=248 / sequence_SO=supercontig / SO=protein_coding / is_pseudo=false